MTIRLSEMEKSATSVGKILGAGFNVGKDLMKSSPAVKEKFLAAGVPDITKLSPESVATNVAAKGVIGLAKGLTLKPRSILHRAVGEGLHQVNAVKRGEPTKLLQTVSKMVGHPIRPPVAEHEGAALFEKKKTIGNIVGGVVSGAAEKAKSFGKSVGEASQRAQLYNTINSTKTVRQKVPASEIGREFVQRFKERMKANSA